MSYTNAEQVRHHLVTPYPLEAEVVDQPIVLTGSDYVRFYGGAVHQSSLRVKSIQDHIPSRSTVGFTNGVATITSAPIAVGSVVVASDSSLGTVYDENADYVVDYTQARLTVKSGGALSGSQQVAVWYLPYLLYVEGTDFSLNAARGEIKRLATGSIADGETVRLDYQPVYVCVADEIVENAVAMANGMVEGEVDPDRQFEVDPTLSAVATYRALEIVCRAAASRELASQQGGDKTASVWLKLADDHARRSDELLSSFRPPYDGLRTPVHS